MIVTLLGNELTCSLTEEEVKAAQWENDRGSTRLSVLFTRVMERRIAAMRAFNSEELMAMFNSMSAGDQDDIREQIHERC